MQSKIDRMIRTLTTLRDQAEQEAEAVRIRGLNQEAAEWHEGYKSGLLTALDMLFALDKAEAA